MKITSTQFIRSPGLYQDRAQREPVVVTKHNREHVVLLSAQEYHRLKRRGHEAGSGGFSDADRAAVYTAKPPLSIDKLTALNLLRAAAPELRSRYGVVSALLFGSVARGEADSVSDADVAVRLSADRSGDVMALCGISGYLSELFGVDVDVVALPARDPKLSAVIEREAVLAF
ncbi:MAG: type II toxin-antitoxin system prevent-host-death family antitoxin [Alphaproteobacteria bacterium]